MADRAAPGSIEEAVLDHLEAEQLGIAAIPVVVRGAALALIAVEDLRADRQAAGDAEARSDRDARAVARTASPTDPRADDAPAKHARLPRAAALFSHVGNPTPPAPAGQDIPHVDCG